MSAGRPNFSISTRIFLGLSVLIVSFATVAIISVAQHRETEVRLRLMKEGYIPLAVTVGEVRVTQSLFAKLLDDLPKDEDPRATRFWLSGGYLLRPNRVKRAIAHVKKAFRLRPGPEDQAELERVRNELRAVEDEYTDMEDDYSRLFDRIDRGEDLDLEVEALSARERKIEDRLRTASRMLDERLASYAAEVVERERRTAVLLAALTGFALFLGVVVVIWVARILAPLSRLHQRVDAVAGGDLSTRARPTSQDEIGLLSRAFEEMVETLGQRDERLRKAHEEQLETRAKLVQSERLAAIGRMAAHVTHEVRNPLSSIGLNVELLEDEVSQSPEARELLASIQSEVDRLRQLTERYLGLARAPDPEVDDVALDDLVNDVLRFVGPELEEAKVDIERHVQDGVRVRADRAQLRQVILNLVRNAQEAMPNGGRLSIELTATDEAAMLSVQDNGPGLDETSAERAFDIFYTTKEGGSGLGLALSQQIVAAHGGNITHVAVQPTGSCFVVQIPK